MIAALLIAYGIAILLLVDIRSLLAATEIPAAK